MPSARGDVVMLDLGANLACDPRNLVEFALLGDMFARTVLGLTAPTIGLLNVGSEELKGDERIRQAAEVLRRSHIGAQFHGFVEGHDIAAGTTDIVVTDGFTGNVALKTGEGALKLVSDLLRQIFTSSLQAKLGYLLARPGLDQMRIWLDPRRYNGAVFLGPERHGGQIAWRHGCRRLCPCAGRGRGHGDAPFQRTPARGPGPAGRRHARRMWPRPPVGRKFIFFEKKKRRTLEHLGGPLQDGASAVAKVFWFFFSKKNNGSSPENSPW